MFDPLFFGGRKEKIQAGLRTHIPNKKVKDANGVVISVAKILPCQGYGGKLI